MVNRVKILAFIIVSFCANLAMAQESSVAGDSIFHVIEILYEEESFDSCLFMTTMFIAEFDAQRIKVDTPELIRVLIYHGDILCHKNRAYKESIQAQNRALNICNLFDPPLIDLKLKSLNVQIDNYIRLGDYKAAQDQCDLASLLLSQHSPYSKSDIAENACLNGVLLMYKQTYDLAEVELRKGIDLYRNSGDTLNLEYTSPFSYLATVLAKLGRYDESIYVGRSAVSKIKIIKGDSSVSLVSFYVALGNTYTTMGNMAGAIQFQKLALQTLEINSPVDSIAVAGICNNIGSVYQLQDKYHLSIEYLQRSIRIYCQKRGYNFSGLVNPYLNLSVSYRAVKDWPKAHENLQHAKRLIQLNYGNGHPYIIEILFLEAYIRTHQQDFDESISIIDEAKNRYKKLNSKDAFLWSKLLLSEATTYKQAGRIDEAILLFENYISVTDTLFSDAGLNAHTAFENLTYIYYEKGNIQKAIVYNDSTIKKLLLHADLNDLTTLNAPSILLDALGLRGHLYYSLYEQNNEQRILELACETDRQALQIANSFFGSALNEETNTFIKSEKQWIFESMLLNAHKLYLIDGDKTLLDLAFNVMEMNKYYSLLQNFIDRRDRQYNDVSRAIIKEESQLVSSLGRLIGKRNIFLTEGKSESAEYRQIGDSLEYYTEQFSDFKEKLKLHSKKYYNQKYRSEFASISDMQNLLFNSKDCIVEYFVGDSSIFTLVIEAEHVGFYEKKIDNMFFEKSNSSLAVMKSPDEGVSQLNESTNYLSSLLIADQMNVLVNYDRVVVVPDRILGYLPFELLRDEALVSDGNPEGYLGLHTTISYAYSASLYQQQAGQHNNRSTSFTGFVADYSNQNEDDDKEQHQLIAMVTRSGELELPDAYDEVLEIKNIVGGNIFTGEEATKNNFIKNSSNAPLIHLAMHTVLNDSLPLESGFIFTSNDSSADNVLTISDLYALDLNADLAVLAACQTGDGEFKKGQGITSLANGFAYAGVNSTVMSLWKVPDKATKKIMVEFYRGLKDGLRKDEALRKSKINYLEHTTEPQERHPYYWAGFIVQGNTNPVHFGSAQPWYFYIIAALVMLLLIALWKNARSQKA